MTPIPLVHRANCQDHPLVDSLFVPTPPSLCPSFADAPAASPDPSEIVEAESIPPSQPLSNEREDSSLPSVSLQKTSLKQSIKSTDFDPNEKRECHCLLEDEPNAGTNDEDEDDEDEEEEKPRSKFSEFLHRYLWSHFLFVSHHISRFVASKHFRRIVLSAIVINTLSMGIEYHGQPLSLTNALEYSNIVFTSLFAAEMLLKLIAEGWLEYIRNAYNLFDGGIVVMSIIELQGNKNSGLSVLRTFRLLRVLKLVRFMPTLRRQLVRDVTRLTFTCDEEETRSKFFATFFRISTRFSLSLLFRW